jgi:hypothetical protein
MDITIRKAEPSDAEAIWKCYTAPQAVRNTLQLPYRSLESVRELLNKSGEGDHVLVGVGLLKARSSGDRPAYMFETPN